jgi:hypothetical protein
MLRVTLDPTRDARALWPAGVCSRSRKIGDALCQKTGRRVVLSLEVLGSIGWRFMKAILEKLLLRHVSPNSCLLTGRPGANQDAVGLRCRDLYL